MKSVLAAAAASAFSFRAIVFQSAFRVITISANLLRERVATCAKRKFAAMQVTIAIPATAAVTEGGYPLWSEGGA